MTGKPITRECNFEVTEKYHGTPKEVTWCNLGKLAKQPCVKEICPIWQTYYSTLKIPYLPKTPDFDSIMDVNKDKGKAQYTHMECTDRGD